MQCVWFYSIIIFFLTWIHIDLIQQSKEVIYCIFCWHFDIFHSVVRLSQCQNHHPKLLLQFDFYCNSFLFFWWNWARCATANNTDLGDWISIDLSKGISKNTSLSFCPIYCGFLWNLQSMNEMGTGVFSLCSRQPLLFASTFLMCSSWVWIFPLGMISRIF